VPWCNFQLFILGFAFASCPQRAMLISPSFSPPFVLLLYHTTIMSRPRRANALRYYGEDDIGRVAEQEWALFAAPAHQEDDSPPPSPPSYDSDSESSSSSSSSEEEEEEEKEEGWDTDATPLLLRPFGGQQKIRFGVLIDRSPLKCFLNFLPNTTLMRMVKETNAYARAKATPEWTDTTLYEIKQFFAALIYMGMVHMGETVDYWGEGTKQEFITKNFTKNRFTQLLQRVHIAPPVAADVPITDKLYKVRWLYDSIRKKCSELYSPSQNLAVDEAMVAFKGRIGFKQYMPKKPTKWGFKVWSLADSSNGYLLNFEIYTGAIAAEEKSDESNAHSMVLRLMSPYEGKYYKLWMDNWFSSIPLFNALLAKKIYASGTIRQNRKGFPKQLVKISKSSIFKKERGKFHFRQSGDVVSTIWMDNGVVSFLSTCVGADTVGKIERRQPNGEKKEVDCPPIVLEYNRSMGAVDLNDQRRATYGIGRKSQRWWMPLFYYLIEICIINSYILYNHKWPDTMTHKAFRVQLMNDLVGDKPKTTSRKKKNREEEEEKVSDEHLPSRSNKIGDCVVCSRREKKDGKEIGKRVRTMYRCAACNVFVCADNCFITLHAE